MYETCPYWSLPLLLLPQLLRAVIKVSKVRMRGKPSLEKYHLISKHEVLLHLALVKDLKNHIFQPVSNKPFVHKPLVPVHIREH